MRSVKSKDEPLVDPNQLLIRPVVAAKLLAISERSLRDLTSPRGPIKAIKLERTVLYSIEHLKRWIDERLSAPTVEEQ